MAQQTYRVSVNGRTRMTFEGDFTQASSPLTIEGDATPLQVADARHRPAEAARLLNDWMRSQGGECWGADEQIEIVAA